jgi:DHA2 family multidrug resistance protein
VITYSQLKPNQNNRASSLTNFFRNWGGSFGIAFVTTGVERRSNFHQSILGTKLTDSSPALQQQVRQSAAYLQSHGVSPPDAQSVAYAHYFSQLQAHAHLLAFMDCFHALGIVTLIAAPLVLATKYFSIGRSKNTPAAH